MADVSQPVTLQRLVPNPRDDLWSRDPPTSHFSGTDGAIDIPGFSTVFLLFAAHTSSRRLSAS